MGCTRLAFAALLPPCVLLPVAHGLQSSTHHLLIIIWHTSYIPAAAAPTARDHHRLSVPALDPPAGTNGGVLYVDSTQAADVSLERVTMERSTAASAGGALWVNGASEVRVSAFEFFSTVSSALGTAGGGMMSVISPTYASVRFTNTTVRGTNTAGSGGTLFLSGSAAAVNVQNLTVGDSLAITDGGLMKLTGNSVLVNITLLTTNNTKAQVGSGGLIQLTATDSGVASVITITDSKVQASSAGLYGGAIAMASNRDLRLHASGLKSASTSVMGTASSGGLMYISSTLGTASLTLSESELQGSSAGHGGLFYVNSSLPATVVLTKVYAGSCSAVAEGGMGSVLSRTAALVNMTLVTAEECVASESHGGVMSMASPGHVGLDAKSVTATKSQAGGSGGVWYVSTPATANVTLYNVTASYNKAAKDGGLLCANASAGYVQLGTFAFYSNSATAGSGGAVHLVGLAASSTSSSSASTVTGHRRARLQETSTNTTTNSTASFNGTQTASTNGTDLAVNGTANSTASGNSTLATNGTSTTNSTSNSTTVLAPTAIPNGNITVVLQDGLVQGCTAGIGGGGLAASGRVNISMRAVRWEYNKVVPLVPSYLTPSGVGLTTEVSIPPLAFCVIASSAKVTCLLTIMFCQLQALQKPVHNKPLAMLGCAAVPCAYLLAVGLERRCVAANWWRQRHHRSLQLHQQRGLLPPGRRRCPGCKLRRQRHHNRQYLQLQQRPKRQRRVPGHRPCHQPIHQPVQHYRQHRLWPGRGAICERQHRAHRPEPDPKGRHISARRRGLVPAGCAQLAGGSHERGGGGSLCPVAQIRAT